MLQLEILAHRKRGEWLQMYLFNIERFSISKRWFTSKHAQMPIYTSTSTIYHTPRLINFKQPVDGSITLDTPRMIAHLNISMDNNNSVNKYLDG